MRTRNQHILARSRAAAGAFTLMEMIVVVIIIAVLATAIGPALWSKIGTSKQAVAKNNAAVIVSAINLYFADYSAFPEPGNLSVLCARPADGKSAPLENCDMLKDPWGRNFILVIPGVKNNTFDVVSYGADGKPGGTGEDEDIVKP
jgi:general secretion pathway protein G